MNKLSPSNLSPAACLGIMLIVAVACVPRLTEPVAMLLPVEYPY